MTSKTTQPSPPPNTKAARTETLARLRETLLTAATRLESDLEDLTEVLELVRHVDDELRKLSVPRDEHAAIAAAEADLAALRQYSRSRKGRGK